MNAGDVMRLLALRHRSDVFVSECKTGGSWTRHCPRLDGWALKKSWEHPMVWGYEVKVSRADFKQDDKWHDYLPYCNQFYFVCPAGLVQPEEVPDPAGLLWVTKAGTAISPTPKKKAAHRQVQVPEGLYRYLLMSRCKIDAERTQPGDSREVRIAVWKGRLEDNREARMIGHAVGKKIAREMRAKHEQVLAAERKVQSYEDIRARITELGFDPETPHIEWDVKSALNELVGQIPRGIEDQLERTKRELENVLQLIQDLKKKGKQ